MPHELTIAPVTTPQGTRAAGIETVATDPPATAGPVGPISHFPNPTLRLESSLGMVVLEFHDDAGEVTRSIPSQRQLDAYRNNITAPKQMRPLIQGNKDD